MIAEEVMEIGSTTVIGARASPSKRTGRFVTDHSRLAGVNLVARDGSREPIERAGAVEPRRTGSTASSAEFRRHREQAQSLDTVRIAGPLDRGVRDRFAEHLVAATEADDGAVERPEAVAESSVVSARRRRQCSYSRSDHCVGVVEGGIRRDVRDPDARLVGERLEVGKVRDAREPRDRDGDALSVGNGVIVADDRPLADWRQRDASSSGSPGSSCGSTPRTGTPVRSSNASMPGSSSDWSPRNFVMTASATCCGCRRGPVPASQRATRTRRRARCPRRAGCRHRQSAPSRCC